MTPLVFLANGIQLAISLLVKTPNKDVSPWKILYIPFSMKPITGFIRAYAREVNKPALLLSTLFVAALVWLNYARGFTAWLAYESGLPGSYTSAHYLIFFAAFTIPYLLLVKKVKRYFSQPGFVACLFIAPLVFALKVGIDTDLTLSPDLHWNGYWNIVLYWPLRLVMVVALLAMIWIFIRPDASRYGTALKKTNWTPYLLMLAIMVPLIAAASTQPDFLATYPKMEEVLPLPPGAEPGWLYKLLFQLAYGSDFFSIELFFRGFLVIGFIHWVGKDAILPMACFYCTIHFGKPMGECISSYFGGLLLGIVSYHTRSIYGGLIVHLGIAWLMEAGGYLGNYYHL